MKHPTKLTQILLFMVNLSLNLTGFMMKFRDGPSNLMGQTLGTSVPRSLVAVRSTGYDYDAYYITICLRFACSLALYELNETKTSLPP